tara:strand:+ start:1259 stop:1555 length:297 start_codon:yes stop_codon:yes gene_type:complete
MITITNTEDITSEFEKFTSDRDGAYLTCRSLNGYYLAQNCDEWAEYGLIDGEPAKVYYIFDRMEDGIDGDPETYPWDADNVTRIEIAEKDEDGEYESI